MDGMDGITHLGGEASLRRRADDSKPRWCHWYPAACETSTRGHYGRPTTTRRQRPTSTRTTSRTIAPQTTKPTPPPATHPAATPPAATPTAKTSAQPAPAPAPSPTAQSTTSAPMAPPPATDTGAPDAQSTSVDPVVVQPNESSTDSPGTGDGADPTATQAGDSVGSGQTTAVNVSPTGASGDDEHSGGQSSLPSVVTPSPSTGGTGQTTGIPGPNVGSGGGASGGGLPPGTIAGIVVGLLLLLLALLALLLYRFRRTRPVQRMLAPFSKRGGEAGGFYRVDAPGGDGMGRTLLTPAPEATATAASNHYGRSLSSQPPMGQTGHLHPLVVPAAAARRDSNRVSVFTNDSAASTGAFTPSPVSPVSPNGMLSPGTVRTSRPVQEPPDPRIIAATNTHVSRGSVSSISTGSAISAVLSPGQMAWPMPPGTPPVIRHPDGPRYLNFEQSGETVVRISQPPRNRRSGGH